MMMYVYYPVLFLKIVHDTRHHFVIQAFLISLGDVDKAREVAEKALQTIGYR